jgi:hypothetical protein
MGTDAGFRRLEGTIGREPFAWVLEAEGSDPYTVPGRSLRRTCAARTPVDPIGLKNEWLTRADRVGLDIDACFDRATRSVAYERLPAEPERPLFDVP